MAINDLASGGVEHTPYTPEQLYAGEAPIVTNWAPALADLVKYQVVLLTPTGLAETGEFDGTVPAVITAQPALTGQNCPYFAGGAFNHEMLVWPAALDTLAKRKAFFGGTPIQVYALHN